MFLAIAASILIAPLWALAQVWGAPRARSARTAAWLGLAIGFALAWTLPLYALVVALRGNGYPAIYAWAAPLFGVASALLGIRVVPIAAAMSVEAVILLPRSWVTRASACLALFGVV